MVVAAVVVAGVAIPKTNRLVARMMGVKVKAKAKNCLMARKTWMKTKSTAEVTATENKWCRLMLRLLAA